MASIDDERLKTELELLESMYPEQCVYDSKARQVIYHGTENAKLELRLPDGYLVDALPEILTATIHRQDIRDEIKKRISECSIGEEVLDSIILAFEELAQEAVENASSARGSSNTDQVTDGTVDEKATIVVWLHHLLNTNKRKQALSPPSSKVAGVTKPGYPGVLIYSGPAKAVHEHVDELKQLNWQAFQVRLESDEEWSFAHGTGVLEVEAMKQVVAEVGDARKDIFMEAMRMK